MTWVWSNSGRWWKTGKPDVLQSMGSQRVRHNWVPEQQIMRANVLIEVVPGDEERRSLLKEIMLEKFPNLEREMDTHHQSQRPLSEWVKSLSHVWLFVTLWAVAYKASPSMGFSRQEYWSGLPFPSPGDLPNPGIEPGSPTLETDVLASEPPGKPQKVLKQTQLKEIFRKRSLLKEVFTKT